MSSEHSLVSVGTSGSNQRVLRTYRRAWRRRSWRRLEYCPRQPVRSCPWWPTTHPQHHLQNDKIPLFNWINFNSIHLKFHLYSNSMSRSDRKVRSILSQQIPHGKHRSDLPDNSTKPIPSLTIWTSRSNGPYFTFLAPFWQSEVTFLSMPSAEPHRQEVNGIEKWDNFDQNATIQIDIWWQ